MIEIKNLTHLPIKKSFFEKIVKVVFLGEKKEGCLSVAIFPEKEIKKLNRFYKKRNKPTDVLSFSLQDDFAGEKPSVIIGEIIICPEFIRKSSASQKEYYKELTLAFIHGLLHLLGYDHKTKAQRLKMQKRENFYLQKFNL